MLVKKTIRKITNPLLVAILLQVGLMSGCSNDSREFEAEDLNNAARELIGSDLSQAKVYAYSALEVATSKSDQFDSYFILGYVENEQGNIGMAISHYMEAIELYPDDPKSISVRKNIGNIFRNIGNYDLAIYHYLSAFDHTVGKKRIEFLTLLGKSYLGNEDWLVAGEYFNLAIEESQEQELFDLLSKSYNLEGLRHKQMGNIDKAREYYLKVIDLKGIKSYEQRATVAFHNLGNSYLIEGDFEKAVTHFSEALSLAKRSKDRFLATMDLGESYLKLNQYDLADKHLNLARELYDEQKANPDYIKVFQHISELNQVQGNKDKALEYSNKFNSETKKYYEVRDDYLQATSIAAVKSFANLYEEGLSNKKVIKKTVYSIWAIAAGGVLSLVLMIMLWLRFVKRKSKMQYELMELIEGL